ncbi:MAG: hypothetical protein MK052_01355 [Alphaproteobacteria bacterium]|nr:hypothetical protein [Alphaproteobacteria bacterium]
MQVTAINAAFTGTQRKTQNSAYEDSKEPRSTFSAFLEDAEQVGETELDAALDRAMTRFNAPASQAPAAEPNRVKPQIINLVA